MIYDADTFVGLWNYFKQTMLISKIKHGENRVSNSDFHEALVNNGFILNPNSYDEFSNVYHGFLLRASRNVNLIKYKSFSSGALNTDPKETDPEKWRFTYSEWSYTNHGRALVDDPEYMNLHDEINRINMKIQEAVGHFKRTSQIVRVNS